MRFLPILADAVSDTSITLPWFAWVAVGGAVVSAVAWLARSYKASVEGQSAQMVALVREVVAAISTNTASLQEVLKAVQESRRE